MDAGKRAKIRDGKTEFLLIGSKKQLNKVTIDSVRMVESEIQPATSAKNLGDVIDSILSMEKHITKTCNAAFYHIYNIRQIRKYLNQESTERMVHAFITSKLDYCNSLMYDLPNSRIQKLQRVQNAAAKTISGARKYDYVTPLLRELHWLPVKEKIELKISLLTFKALNDMARVYVKKHAKYSKRKIHFEVNRFYNAGDSKNKFQNTWR